MSGVIGSGVPVGTPREDWREFGYETRCASVVQVSDFAIRRVKPVSLPIVLGSTFELEDCAHGARLHEKKEQPYADSDGYVYGRWGSPTNEGAARQLAALEGIGPEDDGGCMLFSSGMAAISGSLMASLKSGDHAIFPYTVYGGTNEFLREFLQHLGVTWTLVDSTNPQNYADALQPNTRVVYTESPANPTCRLTDLDAVGQIAIDWAAKTGNKKPWVMCDSTFATPFHQRCLETPGVDVAIHSATKYIGGHSDILAGAVTSSSAEFMHECAKVVKLLGAPLAPLESFLLARGLRTLHVRMERHGENALQAAQLLDDHPLIESTFYPGLPSHPDYELAKKVFTSGGPNSNARQQTFGGMLAFIVKGDPDTALRRAQRMCERLELMTLAVSLGGTESLIEHPASMTHAMIPRSDRLAGGLQDGLVRVSIGLESTQDILRDLKQALDGCDDGK
jgi:methionine-gamma-lyase